MNERIHHINDIIKQVPGLRYDSSAEIFETDRRALYDFAELIVAECIGVVNREEYRYDADPQWEMAQAINEHFGMK